MNPLGLALVLAMTLGQATPTDISPKLEAAFAKSIAYEKQQQNADAIKALADLTGPDQRSYFTQLRLGWLNYRSAKYTEAEISYKAALQAIPNATEAKLGLVLVVLAQLRFAEAETLCKEVLVQDPGNYTRVMWWHVQGEADHFDRCRACGADGSGVKPNGVRP